MAASIPAGIPENFCRNPQASTISGEITCKMALARIRRRTSHTPMGCTPGCLLRAIRWHHVNGMRASWGKTFLASIWARDAMVSQRWLEVSLNAEHIRRQVPESRPHGPADPLARKATVFTTATVSGSNLTLWLVGRSPLSSLFSSAGKLRGCLLSKTSRTLEILPLMVMVSSTPSTFDDEELVSDDKVRNASARGPQTWN